MKEINSRGLGIYFMVFGLLYFAFTIFIANHKIHFTNSAITILVLTLGMYFILKNEKEMNK